MYATSFFSSFSTFCEPYRERISSIEKLPRLEHGTPAKYHFIFRRKSHPVLNCMGLRAQESPGRAKKEALRHRPDLSSKNRDQFEWLPIHEMQLPEVWQTIAAARQTPHWAYAAGMSRLSCCFCIMSSEQDLKTAKRLRPELYQRYVAKEKELGFTLSMSRKTLEEITQ